MLRTLVHSTKLCWRRRRRRRDLAKAPQNTVRVCVYVCGCRMAFIVASSLLRSTLTRFTWRSLPPPPSATPNSADADAEGSAGAAAANVPKNILQMWRADSSSLNIESGSLGKAAFRRDARLQLGTWRRRGAVGQWMASIDAASLLACLITTSYSWRRGGSWRGGRSQKFRLAHKTLVNRDYYYRLLRHAGNT